MYTRKKTALFWDLNGTPTFKLPSQQNDIILELNSNIVHKLILAGYLNRFCIINFYWKIYRPKIRSIFVHSICVFIHNTDGTYEIFHLYKISKV